MLRLKAPGLPASRKAVALSTDGNGRWCLLDPRRGTAMVVAESALNVACVGAVPSAVVNCLNFGNPEHAEVMWQLSEAIDGMGEACDALGIPVVGGNVSLYNESRGRDIDPTPVIGTLGLIDDLAQPPPGAVLAPGAAVVLLGDPGADALAGSLWARVAPGHRGGTLPAIDLDAHRRLVDLVAGLVADGQLAGVHDVSEGGLGVALAEMAVRAGVGCRVAGIATHAHLFSEAPSRVVLAVAPERVDAVVARADAAGVPATMLGRGGGDRVVVDGLVDEPLERLAAAWRDAIPAAVAGDL